MAQRLPGGLVGVFCLCASGLVITPRRVAGRTAVKQSFVEVAVESDVVNDAQLPSLATLDLTSNLTARGSSSFDWWGSWYPVEVVSTMDPTRPHKVELLGMSLVAWNDGPTDERGVKHVGEWRVFADACPHRQAPLSEGRVEDDGQLLCSYHGWKFAGCGSCSSLPYSEPQAEERHRRRASCQRFPSRVVNGLLFVFPQEGAFDNEVPLPLISELEQSPELWDWKLPAGVRDFPCGWDAMVENTLDPAHFCAAHHGTLGDRYSDPAPYRFDLTRRPTSAGGFALSGDLGRLEFVPPCLVKFTPDYHAMPFKGSLVIATYCVPTRPGHVRPLATVLQRKESGTESTTIAVRALSVFMGGWTPAWLGHVLSSVVLHQDAGLLYGQYRNLRESGLGVDRDYEDVTWCPNQVDRGVTTFRRWLKVHGGGGPEWACDDTLCCTRRPPAPAALYQQPFLSINGPLLLC